MKLNLIMQNRLFFSIIILLPFTLSSCNSVQKESDRGITPQFETIHQSDTLTVKEATYTFEESFDKIDIGGPWEIKLIKDGKPKMIIQAPEQHVMVIKPVIKNKTLRLESDKNIKISELPNPRKLIIYYKNLSSIRGSAALHISGEDVFDQESLTIEGDGVAAINLKLKTGKTVVKGAKASKINLTGTSIRLEADFEMASFLNGESLKTKVADLKITKGGEIKISVTDSLFAKATDAGNIFYKGTPKLKEIEKQYYTEVTQID